MKAYAWLVLAGCQAEVEEPATVETAPVVEEAQGTPLAAAEPGERPMSEAAARGLDIAKNTHVLLPDNVGNTLNCTNCHLENATRPKAAPWVGVVDRYPRYRKRSGRVDDLQDRMNGCFERSMNGTKLERDSEPMLALVAYAEWLSVTVDGKDLPGTGMPRITAPEAPDAERGQVVFQNKCAACHQPDGSGITAPNGVPIYPPVAGDASYNVAAGMARLDTAAAFVKWNMPLGQGGTLTDQQAYDVASWFIFEARPDFAKKDQDWPDGEKPSDARY